jgi:DNA-binding NtrC family response regulator
MKDLELPEYAAWAEKRITLKHNWFDRLADVVVATPNGAEVPAGLQRWSEELPKLIAWINQAASALSPGQVLALAAFQAWPEEFRQRQRQRLDEQFLTSAPEVKQLIEECLALFDSLNRELSPLLGARGRVLSETSRTEIARMLSSISRKLRQLPEHVEWPEPKVDDLPAVLVIDDLLGRVSVQQLGLPVISGEAMKELQELRRSFCHRFHLLDGDYPEQTAQVRQPIARAFFCPGQRYDADRGFVNDLEIVKRYVLKKQQNQGHPLEWSLIIVDVLFNTGLPGRYGRGDGESRFGIEEIIPCFRENAIGPPIIALTTESSYSLIQEAQRLGVEYLNRSESSHADLLVHIARGGYAAPAQLRRALNVPKDFIAEDPRMIEVLMESWIAAQDPTGKTVLIIGEPGAGKERLAKFIHEMSPRFDKALEIVNCARYSKELADTELFGYYASSFTGAASTDIRGKFHEANGGTLILDEFGDLDRDVQAKLLRTLEPKRAQDRIIEPRGNKGKFSKLPTQVDVRVICCTNQPLHLVRDDLRTRVAKVIEIPPLRDRVRDIVPLARYFLSNSEGIGTPGVDLDETACQFLEQTTFWGNARTLEQLIDAAATGKGGRNIITRRDLKAALDAMLKNLGSADEIGPLAARAIGEPSRDSSSPVPAFSENEQMSEAVAYIISLMQNDQNWMDRITKREIDKLDATLQGHILEVISILIEWTLFRNDDVPAITEYITGQRTPGRTPEDFVKRLLKLDRTMFGLIASSPHLSSNLRLREIVNSCSDEWGRRSKTL